MVRIGSLFYYKLCIPTFMHYLNLSLVSFLHHVRFVQGYEIWLLPDYTNENSCHITDMIYSPNDLQAK